MAVYIVVAVVCVGVAAVITFKRARVVYKARAPWTFSSGDDDEEAPGP